MQPHSHSGPAQRAFIPAAGHDRLLPLYDPFVRLILRNEKTRGALVAGAAIAPGQRVLDLGTGTGELALLIKRRHPGALLTAVDPDAKALAIARAKAERAGLELALEPGFGDALPFADGAFDRVLSSLVLHHLTRAEKLATLREVRRVLAPGGSLHVLDFGPPRSGLDRALTHLVHHGERMAENLGGELPALMTEAGLAGARESASIRTLLGRLSLYEARRG